MRTNQLQTTQDLKELRAEVSRLSKIVKDMPQQASEDAANVIGFDRRDLRKMAKTAGKNARRFLSDKQAQVVDLRDEAEEQITSHPFRAIAAALTSGLLIGTLLRRR